MPLALLIALAGSLAVHAAALFGPEIALFDDIPEAPPLRAELRPPPPVPPAVASELPPKSRAPAKPKRVQHSAGVTPAVVPAALNPLPEAPVTTVASPQEAAEPALPALAGETQKPDAMPAPPEPLLQVAGVIRFSILHEGLGVTIGQAEHRWEFSPDGHYRLQGSTETSGLVALFKPVRVEYESRGVLTAQGLRPEQFRTVKNGKPTTENADFDWSTGVVHLARDDSVRSIAPGAQDVLSLNYQLAYLPRLAEGVSVGVVTGKKYERYALDALGEESLDLPAGRFRTLHLRAMTDSVTEIWIALDHQRLPVKIRFTDRKGERFVQLATELGSE